MRDRMREDVTSGIYFEYLTINGFSNSYHIVSLDEIGYHFLMPSNYTIAYHKSLCKYGEMGHIRFYNGSNKFDFDYFKEDYGMFKYNVDLIMPKIKKSFTNYREQMFYEVAKDDKEAIYLYFEGFMYRFRSYHKLSINEYLDIYLMLLSLTSTVISTNVDLLKEILYFHRYALESLVAGSDLLTENLSNKRDLITLSLDDVSVNSDADYMAYKDKYKDYIDSAKNNDVHPLSVVFDNSWVVEGTFSFEPLGNYDNIHIKDYQEIIDAQKLTTEEKSALLTTMILERQMEVDSHKTRLKNELYRYIASYFSDCITYDIFVKTHFKEFLNPDILKLDEDSSDLTLYTKVLNYLDGNRDNYEAYDYLFNYKKIRDNVLGKEMLISPDTFILKLSLCNGLLENINLVLDDNYFIKY